MKRRIVMLLVFLLLGAIVNVAVAWGFALVQDIRQPIVQVIWANRRALTDEEAKWYSAHEAWLALPQHLTGDPARVLATPTAADERRPGWLQSIYIEEYRGGGRRKSSIRRPDGKVIEAVNIGVTTFTTARSVECGWPMRSMSQARWPAVNTGSTIDSGWRLPHWLGLISGSRSCVVPLKASAPEFAINTLFYAAILWLLFAAPFALRRWRRIKRCLCPACAYPVGTSEVCTECGKPVMARSVGPSA